MPDPASVADIVGDRTSQPQQLVEVLQDIQQAHGHISEDAMRAVSGGLGVSLLEVYRVANFYKAFSLRPRGKHTLTVCSGTACHVRGANLMVEQVRAQLGLLPGQTTDDGLFTLETVNCLGACALGPILVVDGHYHHHVTPAKLRRVIRSLQNQHARRHQTLAQD
jgi:NADH:ubiquinone oxidoreductase subunit E